MKKLIFNLLAFFIIISFSQTLSYGQQDLLKGTWEGMFMEQFKIVIVFKDKSPNHYSGNLKLWDGPTQIQNDGLTSITIEGKRISFYIPAKSTPFNGEITYGGKAIEGKFTFPDGSKHSLFITKSSLSDSENNKVTDPFNTGFTKEQLTEDLNFISDKLKELHPALYEYQSAASFESRLDRLSEGIQENETQANFYLIASSLTSAVGCSHTGLRLPESSDEILTETGNYFPCSLFFNNHQAYLITVPPDNNEVIPGTKVLSINGTPVNRIIESIFEFIPAEGNNTTTKYFEINKNFAEYFVLLDNSQKFNLLCETADKRTFFSTIESCSSKEINASTEMEPVVSEGILSIDFQIRKQDNTAVLTIPTFGINDINYYIYLMDSLFTQMQKENIENLIIDLRGNSGGHPIFAAQLYSYLTKTNFAYFDPIDRVEEFAPLYTSLPPSPIHFSGNSYVLVNGGCLSTTGHLISLLKYHKISTIIGEEPGSSFRCNDMSRQFVLTHSCLELNVPTKIFQTAVTGFTGETPMVDIDVDIHVSDIIIHNDPYMDKAKELIAKKKIAEL